MDLMDDELRRVLSGSVDAPTDSMARELARLRVRDRGPTATERAAASQPSFRMPSSGRRRPEQRGGGEALETLGSAIAGSVPAGLAGAAVLPFQGPEGAAKTINRVQDYLTIDPQTEGGVRALRGIAGALSPLGAPAQAAGDVTLRATGSPLLATGAELLADPLNLLGIGATAKPVARAAAAGARQAGKAAKATGQSLGPKAAEMAEAYMRRSGMTPEITTYHGTPHTFPAEPGLPLGRFRAEKIGSGEGAQAYGHGIYVAETPDVAKQYRKELATDVKIDGQPFMVGGKKISTTGNRTIDDFLTWHVGDVEEAIKAAERMGFNEYIPKLENLKGRIEKVQGGSFYTVDLPDPMVDRMLDWDKPVKEQSQQVQKIIQQLVSQEVGQEKAAELMLRDSFTGQNAMLHLPAKSSIEDSQVLRRAGIPGIKYLDEGSRGAGEGTRNFVVFPGEEDKLTILQRNDEKLPTKKADGGLIGETMSYTTAADTIADKLMRQGMDPDQAFMTALRMSDARMKAGGAVLMAGGGDAERELTLQARNRNLAALDRGLAPRARKTWDGPMIDRPIVNGKALVSAEELADFRRRFGEKMTLRDLLNADKGRGPSGAMPAARGAQGANVAPRGPLIRPDEAATLPPVGLSDIPGLVMRGMAEGAERVPAGRGAGAAFVGAGAPRAAMAAKTLRDHPSITPAQRQMLKEMEDYISGLNQADRPAVDPKIRALEERLEPPMAGGGAARKLTARAAARAEARLAEKAAKEAAERAAKQAAIDARTPTERAVVEKFGQKQEQEAARAKKVEQISQADAPQRDVKPAGRRVKVAPDVYRVMADTQGDAAVLQAARAGQHLKPTPQGYVGAPRTVTNPQALGGMRRAMDKDFADAVEAVRLADPERLGTWYDRAKQGIAESAEPYQLPRTLEQHGVYSAGVSPESELGFALKHLNSRAAGEPAMAYRGAPMRNLDEAVAQNRPANMGFKIGEYMNKNDPRIPNEGLFGVNDFRRAQGMGYTDPAGNPWKAGVSETMHPFMDAETALQVDRANRGAIGGRTDWAGPHIQEVPWVYGKGQDLYSRGKSGRFGGDELEGIKRSLVEANNTARDYMYKHAASATHEAVPGASLGHVPQVLSMTPEEKLAYGNVGRWDRPAPEMELSDLPGVGAGNRDVLYGALGYRQLPSRQAEGLYINKLGQVETNPMTIARPLMDFPTGGGGLMAPESRKVADTLEQFRAFMDAQEAGAYNLPNTMSAVKNKNSLLLDSRNLNPDKLGDPSAGVIPTSDQLARLNAAMEGTGFGVSATNRGVVVFPYDPTMDAKEAAKILRKKQGELTAIYPSDPQKSLTTMGYVPGIGKRSAEGPLSTVPFSGEATGDLLQAFSELNPAVAQNLSESEFVRQIIRDKALRDAKLGGTRRDIQESRRFFSEADWPKAVELIRKGMSTAAALAALGYSASSMAEEGR